MKFNEILKKLRTSLSEPPPKVTQEQMSEKMGVSRRVYSRMETGSYIPSNMLKRYILALAYINKRDSAPKTLRGFFKYADRKIREEITEKD